MKITTGIALGILPIAISAQTIHPGQGGYGAQSSLSPAYNRSTQVIFTGKVVGTSSYVPATGVTEEKSLLVKSKKVIYEVKLGPKWYVDNQIAHAYVGEKVRVIGSSVTMGNSPVILAKAIVNTDNNHVLALRDLEGYPYWIATRAGTDAVASNSAPTPNSRSVEGTVQSLQTVSINGTPYQAYVVQNANGTFNVLTAPTWYMANQDFSVPVGTYIRAVGGPGPINLGNGTILANSLYSGSGTIILRDAGVPVWGGNNNFNMTIQ